MKHKVLIEEVIMAYRKLMPKKKKGICETIFEATRNGEKFDASIFENFEVKYERMCPAR